MCTSPCGAHQRKRVGPHNVPPARSALHARGQTSSLVRRLMGSSLGLRAFGPHRPRATSAADMRSDTPIRHRRTSARSVPHRVLNQDGLDGSASRQLSRGDSTRGSARQIQAHVADQLRSRARHAASRGAKRSQHACPAWPRQTDPAPVPPTKADPPAARSTASCSPHAQAGHRKSRTK